VVRLSTRELKDEEIRATTFCAKPGCWRRLCSDSTITLHFCCKICEKSYNGIDMGQAHGPACSKKTKLPHDCPKAALPHQADKRQEFRDAPREHRKERTASVPEQREPQRIAPLPKDSKKQKASAKSDREAPSRVAPARAAPARPAPPKPDAPVAQTEEPARPRPERRVAPGPAWTKRNTPTTPPPVAEHQSSSSTAKRPYPFAQKSGTSNSNKQCPANRSDQEAQAAKRRRSAVTFDATEFTIPGLKLTARELMCWLLKDLGGFSMVLIDELVNRPWQSLSSVADLHQVTTNVRRELVKKETGNDNIDKYDQELIDRVRSLCNQLDQESAEIMMRTGQEEKGAEAREQSEVDDPFAAEEEHTPAEPYPGDPEVPESPVAQEDEYLDVDFCDETAADVAKEEHHGAEPPLAVDGVAPQKGCKGCFMGIHCQGKPTDALRRHSKHRGSWCEACIVALDNDD